MYTYVITYDYISVYYSAIYIDYLSNQLDEASSTMNKKQSKYFEKFIENMINGVDYYLNIFTSENDFFKTNTVVICKELNKHKEQLLGYSKIYSY